MEGEAGDFHDDDWELLHDSSSLEPPPPQVGFLLGIDDDDGTEGMIRPDYFSIDGSKLYAKPLLLSHSADDPTTDSDNPSWVDPGSDSHFAGRRNSAELWSDSGSDHSDERKFSDFVQTEVKMVPVGLAADKDVDTGFEFDGSKLSDFGGGDAARVGLGEIRASDRDDPGSGQLRSDSAGDRVNAQELDAAADESRAEQKGPKVEAVVEKVEAGGERRRIAWWKVPFEVLRYCVLRVGPIWSLSVAAAVVGIVILSRRLHRMKQKSRTLQLKVTLDDKKVSQFKSRAARLNEAFSVVRRVPVVRPALPGPAAGVAPSWPMMSLR